MYKKICIFFILLFMSSSLTYSNEEDKLWYHKNFGIHGDIEFTNDSKYVVGIKNRNAVVIDVVSGEIVKEFFYGSSSHKYFLDLSPDNRFLAMATWEHYPLIWDFETGEVIDTVQYAGLSSIQFSEDNSFLALGIYTTGLIFYDYINKKEIEKTFQVLVSPESIDFSNDNKFISLYSSYYKLGTSDLEYEIRIYEIETGKTIFSIYNYHYYPGIMQFANNKFDVYYSDMKKEYIRGYELSNYDIIFEITAKNPFKNFVISPDDNFVITSFGGIYDIITSTEIYKYDVTGLVACSPDLKYIAIGSSLFNARYDGNNVEDVIEPINNISITPNPAQTSVVVSFTSDVLTHLDIVIRDINGNLIDEGDCKLINR